MMSNTKISMKLICMLQLPLCFVLFFSLLLSKYNFFVFCLEDTDWSRHTDWQMIQTGAFQDRCVRTQIGIPSKFLLQLTESEETNRLAVE